MKNWQSTLLFLLKFVGTAPPFRDSPLHFNLFLLWFLAAHPFSFAVPDGLLCPNFPQLW